MPFHQLVFLIFWITACSYVAVRGGAPERIAAGAIVLAILATTFLSFLLRPRAGAYGSMELGVAFTDVALFATLVALALSSARFWPMLMASMQGCGMMGHLAKPLAPDIIPKAYYVTVAFWAYPIILLLIVATWRHRVRLKRYGVDYAWVWDLPRRYREDWSVNELAPPLPQN